MEKEEAKKQTAHVQERGFTLLLAALVASIVLAIGTSIFQLAQKELILSSIGRDSQYAFYAADTGAECALYWDVRYQAFATSSETAPLEAIICDNQSSDVSPLQVGETVHSSFQFEPNGYCASVSVTKAVQEDTGAVASIIHADGYSTTCDAIETSPRALQRSVELRY